MKNEKEIRNRLKKIIRLENNAAKDIDIMYKNNEIELLDLCIDRANMYQHEKNILEWVLRKD